MRKEITIIYFFILIAILKTQPLVSKTVTEGVNTKTKVLQQPSLDLTKLPRSIYWKQGERHVQGIAIDKKLEYVYFSFTTSLVKTDLNGNFIGSVEGITGHLGAISINPEDGRLYASLEYTKPTRATYIAIFDVDKIIHGQMNAETDGVVTTIYLEEVANDYNAVVNNQGKEFKHKYGSSGIDGIAFGPQFGKTAGEYYLNVAYGIYPDINRTDNDYQIILQYDINSLKNYEQPLAQNNMHRIGPEKSLNRYFLFTGNTNFGIQNFTYDPNTSYWFVAVYKGKKSQYPNYPLFTIDGTQKAELQTLKGIENNEQGQVLQLAKAGLYDKSSDLYGWQFRWGSTGICSLGNGYFYISQNGVSPDKKQYCNLRLYKWTGDSSNPFEEVK